MISPDRSGKIEAITGSEPDLPIGSVESLHAGQLAQTSDPHHDHERKQQQKPIRSGYEYNIVERSVPDHRNEVRKHDIIPLFVRKLGQPEIVSHRDRKQSMRRNGQQAS